MTLPVILVADDNEFERNLMCSALERKGFVTCPAVNGAECLEILNAKKIDLVLLDVVMPGESGIDILKKIREMASAIEMPVIMVTGRSDTADVVSGLKHGANDYIAKPINLDVVVSRITTHLQLSQASREMSRLKQIAALDAMITTYNHEINNPLSIALWCLESKDFASNENIQEKLKRALWRISTIVKSIREVTEKKEIELDDYTQESKMVKIKNSTGTGS